MSEIDKQKLKNTLKAFSPFYYPETIDDPFVQFFGVEENVDTMQSLRKFANNALQKFKSQLDNKNEFFDKIHDELQGKIGNFIRNTESKHKDLLPMIVVEINKDNINQYGNVGIEINKHQHVDVLQNQEQQLEQELRLELESYNYYGSPRFYNEVDWDDRIATDFISTITKSDTWNKDNLSVMKLSEFMKKVTSYRDEYYKIFDDNIYATRNFCYSIDERHTVFYKLQRPASQLLAIKTGDNNLKFVMLSEKEAFFYKLFLQKEYENNRLQNIFLIQSCGTPFVQNKFLNINIDRTVENALKRGLLQANIFNCDSHYLIKHSDETIDWIRTNADTTNIKKKFLKLKVENHPLNKHLLYSSNIIDSGKEGSDYGCLYRYNEKNQNFDPNSIKRLSEREIYTLNKCKVKYLAPEQIKYMNDNYLDELCTKEQFGAVIKHNIKWIDKLNYKMMMFIEPRYVNLLTRVNLINSVPESIIKELKLEHYKNVEMNNLSMLSIEQIGWLTDIKLFEQKLPIGLIHHINGSLLSQLNKNFYLYLTNHQLSSLGNNIEMSGDINVEMLKKFNNNQLSNVNDKAINYIFTKDLGTFTTLIIRQPNLINKLSGANVALINDADLIKTLNNNQLSYVNAEVINNIFKDDLNTFNRLIDRGPNLISKLNEANITSINDVDLIKTLNNNQLSYVNAEVINNIFTNNFETFKALIDKEPNLINKLSEVSIALINDVELIKKLNNNQLSHVNDGAINNIFTNYLETFKALITKQPNLINKLSEVSIASINDVDLIKKLNNNQLSHVNDGAINNIFTNYFETFKALITKQPNLINKLLKDNFLNLLQNDDDLKIIIKQRMQDVGFVRQLLQGNNDNIINRFIIPNLDADTISILYNENNLHVNNIQHCNQGQCKDFSNIKLVRNLKNEQLPYISNGLVKEVSLLKVHHLLPGQIAYATKLQKLALYVTTIALGVLSILTAILLSPTLLFYKKYNVVRRFWDRNFLGVDSKLHRMWLLFS